MAHNLDLEEFAQVVDERGGGSRAGRVEMGRPMRTVSAGGESICAGTTAWEAGVMDKTENLREAPMRSEGRGLH